MKCHQSVACKRPSNCSCGFACRHVHVGALACDKYVAQVLQACCKHTSQVVMQRRTWPFFVSKGMPCVRKCSATSTSPPLATRCRAGTPCHTQTRHPQCCSVRHVATPKGQRCAIITLDNSLHNSQAKPIHQDLSPWPVLSQY